MSFEKESRLRVNQAEGREKNLESKDKQTEELEKKMGARERVELVSKEVKSTQQQMQNIMMNMQQVVKAVAALRQQLQLKGTNGTIPSVDQDQKIIESLQKRLVNLKSQLNDLRSILINEERERLRGEDPSLNKKELESKAQKIVEDTLESLKTTE